MANKEKAGKEVSLNKTTNKPVKTETKMENLENEQVSQEVEQEQGEKKQEPNSVLYPNELVNALIEHFTKKPHVMSEVEGIVNALRNGIPVIYNPEEKA